MGIFQAGQGAVVACALVVGEVGAGGGEEAAEDVCRSVGGGLQRHQSHLIVPKTQSGGKLVAGNLHNIDRNCQRLLPGLLQQAAHLGNLAVRGHQQLDAAKRVGLQLVHARAVGLIGGLRIVGVDGIDGGLFGVGLGEQGDGRRDQPVIGVQVVLLVGAQEIFQRAAVDGTDKALPHLLIGKGAVGLVKDQRPDGPLRFLAGKPRLLGLQVL